MPVEGPALYNPFDPSSWCARPHRNTEDKTRSHSETIGSGSEECTPGVNTIPAVSMGFFGAYVGVGSSWIAPTLVLC